MDSIPIDSECSSSMAKQGWLTQTKNFIKKWKNCWRLPCLDGKIKQEVTEPDGVGDHRTTGVEDVSQRNAEAYSNSVDNVSSYNPASVPLEDNSLQVAPTKPIGDAHSTEYSLRKERISLQDFKLLRVLGRGGFGKVVLCREHSTSSLYAMKVIKKDVIVCRNEVHHIQSEGRLLGTLRHPFIIALKYSFQTQSQVCFVMEFANGGDLYFHLTKCGRFTEERTRFYSAEVVSAIHYLHTNDIIYRDLKAENLLLDRDGHIKLADLGLCKENVANGTPTNSLCGTPQYMAPELFQDKVYDKSVDWWGLGVIMYEMIYGKLPFYSQNFEVLISLITTKSLQLPPHLRSLPLIITLARKKPNRRLGSGSNGAHEIKDHCFFESISWIDLELKKIPVPYTPKLNSDDDTRYFESSLILETSIISTCSLSHTVKASREDHFLNFSFQDMII